MKTIQQEVNKFLRIVLVHTLEHDILFSYLSFYLKGREDTASFKPHFIEELGI